MTDIISKFIQENLELCAPINSCVRVPTLHEEFVFNDNSRTALPKSLKALEIAVNALRDVGILSIAYDDSMYALAEIEELLK